MADRGPPKKQQTRVLSHDEREWLDVLASNGFPLREYHSNDTPREHWEELARWHERMRREWNAKRRRGAA